VCLEPTMSGESVERILEVAHIIWYDIEDRSSPGWVSWDQALEDAIEPFSLILTAGIILCEDDVRVSLTSSAGPDETAGALTIPKSLIVSDCRHRVSVPTSWKRE
jgi:hypothetical protein